MQRANAPTKPETTAPAWRRVARRMPPWLRRVLRGGFLFHTNPDRWSKHGLL